MTFAAVDLAGAAAILAAVVMAMPARDAPVQRSGVASSIYSGLLAGFAVGCKVSFAPAVVVLVLMQAFADRRLTLEARVMRTAAFVVAAAATGCFWYLRTWGLTGNPLFPAEVAMFEGPFGADDQSRTQLIGVATRALTNGDGWVLLSLVRSHVDWPLGLFLASAAGYCWYAIGLAFRRQGMRSGSPGMTWLFAIGIVLMVFYPAMPFTGTYNSSDAGLNVSLRYLIAPFAIGICLVAHMAAGVPWRQCKWWIVAAVIAAVGSGVVTQSLGRGLTFLASGLVTFWLVDPRLKPRWIVLPMTLKLLAVPVALGLLVLLAPYRQRMTDEQLFRFGDSNRPVGAAWRAMDSLPAGARLTWFGPSTYQYYALFGRELQLVPTPMGAEGGKFVPDHQRFAAAPYSWWGARAVAPDRASLIRSLAELRTDYVFVSKWDGQEWPPEQNLLAESAEARRVFDDGYSAIWRIVGNEVEPDANRR